MGTDVRQRTTWGSRFRFLIRLIGLAGIVATAVGAVLTASVFPTTEQWTAEIFRGVLRGNEGPFAETALWILVGGLIAIAVALLVEVIAILFLAASRRTAAETSAIVGTIAAAAILVFANAYSFDHYRRYDITRNRQFTIPANVADDLRKLRPDSPTTIVVFQQHKTSGTLAGKPDSYDYAAERKIVEKVKDLVDQFREFGPQFHVAVLDVEDEGFERQLADLTKDAPELKSAIDAAPENSIFFHANKRVQRLGFNEFLQLDKTASKAANDGNGNLVLLPQGVESFARRILAVQERRPKAALCVVHEWLTTKATEGQEQFSSAGLRKALEDYGFEVVDVVVRSPRLGNPAAFTLDETKLERLESELEDAEDRVRSAQASAGLIPRVKKALDEMKKRPVRERSEFYGELGEVARARLWLDVLAVYRKWIEGDKELGEKTEPEFQADLHAGLDRQAGKAARFVAEVEKERRAAEEKVEAARKDERVVQDRRVTNVKEKFSRLLSDVDLLIVPRMTVINATIGDGIDPELHALNKEQAEVIKEFMKTGKPVLALLGPISDSDANGPDTAAIDPFERMLAERGIVLGKETILFDGEAQAFSARRAGNLLGGAGPAEIPPLAIADVAARSDVAPNPVGEALRITGRSVDQKLDIRLRAPRPVYVADGWQKKLPFAAEFVLTSPDAWNEAKPFPEMRRLPDRPDVFVLTYSPKFEPPADTGVVPVTEKGSRDEERRGPFPVAVAIEGKVPAEWFDEEYGREKFAAALLSPLDAGMTAAAITAASTKLDRPTGRLIVIGSGSIFTGADLKPAQQKFLLHSVNWLVNRPDRLPSVPEQSWSFPRVEMSDRDRIIWRGATSLLLPLSAVFLGLLAVMVRRTR